MFGGISGRGGMEKEWNEIETLDGIGMECNGSGMKMEYAIVAAF